MRDYNLRLLLKVAVVLSYVLLAIFVLTVPRFDYAQADPYFQFNVMPPVYWMGVITSVAALLMSVFFWKKDTNQTICFGLLSLLALTIFTNSAPRLIYENPIWMDTFTFLGETLDITNSGHIGWGEALDVPGVSLVGSQLSLVTGLDYTIIAGFLPSLLSVIMVLMIYAVAQLFISKRGAILAGATYVGLYYIGFYFNRRCFSLPLQVLVWYFLARFMLGKRERSWFAALLLAFVALVVAHPATSFVAVLNSFAPIFVYLFIKILKFLRIAPKSNPLTFKTLSKIVSLPISLLFIVIWFAWYAYHPGPKRVFEAIVSQTVIALNKFSASVSPTSSITANVGGYSQGYYPIVALRLFDILFVVLAGLGLALLYLFSKKLDLKKILLASWFVSGISLISYVIYASRLSWSDMPFRYALPAFAILVGWFVLHCDFHKPFMKKMLKAAKVAILGLVIFFVMVSPLTMYAHAAFVYPPTSNLEFTDFLTSHRPRAQGGLVGVIGGHMEIDYFRLVNSNYDPPIILCIYGNGFNASNLEEYDVVGWNFRVFVKDAFEDYGPSLTQSLANLEQELPLLHYTKIYDSPRHGLYIKPS